MTEPVKLDFQIEIDGNRGTLVLGPKRYFGFLDVGRIDFQLSDLEFPVQITEGIAQFKDETSHVTQAMSVSEEGLGQLLHTRRPELAEAGFSNVVVRLADMFIIVGGTVEGEGRLAEFTCRIKLDVNARGLRFSVRDGLLFGFVGRPCSKVLYDFFAVLLGFTHASIKKRRSLAVGIGTESFVIQPLNWFLSSTLPSAGWAMPVIDRIQVGALKCDSKGLTVSFAARHEDPLAVLGIMRADKYAKHHRAARALLDDDWDVAAEVYAAFASEHPEDFWPAATRTLDLFAARAITHDRVTDLASSYLEEYPDYIEAQLALATVAVAEDNPTKAADYFDSVARLALDAGHQEVALRAWIAGARQVQTCDRVRHDSFYEKIAML